MVSEYETQALGGKKQTNFLKNLFFREILFQKQFLLRSLLQML